MLHLYPSSLLRSVGARGEGRGAVFGPCMEHAVAILASPRAVLLWGCSYGWGKDEMERPMDLGRAGSRYESESGKTPRCES